MSQKNQKNKKEQNYITGKNKMKHRKVKNL